MEVRLLLFAVLREIVGVSDARIELADGATAADVWQRLKGEYPQLAAFGAPPLVAVNQEYADPAAPLRHGDEVAFIPPVSGG